MHTYIHTYIHKHTIMLNTLIANAWKIDSLNRNQQTPILTLLHFRERCSWKSVVVAKHVKRRHLSCLFIVHDVYVMCTFVSTIKEEWWISNNHTCNFLLKTIILLQSWLPAYLHHTALCSWWKQSFRNWQMQYRPHKYILQRVLCCSCRVFKKNNNHNQ